MSKWIKFVKPALQWQVDDVTELDDSTALWLVNMGKAVYTSKPAPVVEAAAVEPEEKAVKPRAKRRTTRKA